ncbi:MAG UNVERIFIED_CONTAM: hypothetical protein LVR29_30995 [Microcystis novacekii LVE1205-3]
MQLLDNLQAPASVYLLQFRLSHREVVFDLSPALACACAIASLCVCHRYGNSMAAYWNCSTSASNGRSFLADLIQ